MKEINDNSVHTVHCKDLTMDNMVNCSAICFLTFVYIFHIFFRISCVIFLYYIFLQRSIGGKNNIL